MHHPPSSAVHPLLGRAVSMHQAGQMAEAGELYQKIMKEIPGHFDATHLLGVIALQEGRLDDAQNLIASALRINPKHSGALNNLGMVHLRGAEPELALKQFERAVRAQPDSCDALANLGSVLRQLGRPREALVPLRRAHSSNPKSAAVCNLIGACLIDTGDAHAAVKVFELATIAQAEEADGWSNLAIALNNVGEHGRAEECAGKAVALSPESSAALAARAAVEFEEGDVETAIATYREAVLLPNPSTQTYCALANALWTGGRCDEAQDYLRQALTLDRNNVLALWKLAMSQCRTYYGSVGEMEASRRAFSESLDELEDWFRAVRRPQAFAAVGSTQPFFIAYQPFNNQALLGRYGKLCCEWMASMPDAPAKHGKSRQGGANALAGRRMRIGIASAHIRDHSVWNAITKGWIGHIDRSRFEVWLFQLGRAVDEETAWAKREVAHFEEGPKTVQAWARTIDDARLDALIYPEIGMDALTTQLASLRLAPVQAASWGHPETTGLPTMDLYLSADALEPAEAQGNYSERLVRLPNLGVCVAPLTPSIAAPNLQQLGLPGDEPLLLCPGTPFKYSPAHDHLWARIARGLRDGSAKRGWARFSNRLLGKSSGRLVFFRSGNATMDDLLARRLRKAFDVENVDFDVHARVIPQLDRPRFFGLMQRAALLLDTVGFSGFNNTLQAVEAGLPVLAHEGAFLRSRLASGILRRMALPELVAGTDEAFIGKAVELAQNPVERQALRDEIAKRRSILFADVEPVRAFERCLTDAIGRSNGQTAGDARA